jgi:hypothetical protein
MTEDPVAPTASEPSVATKPKAEPPHPLAGAAQRFIHAVRDIQECWQAYIPAARKAQKANADGLIAQLEQLKLDAAGHSGPYHASFGKRLSDSLGTLERLANSRHAKTLATSLFLGLFSVFDAFMGDLLRALFERRPELFSALGGSVDVKEILRAKAIGELKDRILDHEIEALRRKSYVEQMQRLESLFDIRLRQFATWPVFVEAGQRRHLFAHCKGVVSAQYLLVCKGEGCVVSPDVSIGATLELSDEYFDAAARAVLEVGFKLAQTLWRKVLPDEIEDADRHLHAVAYDALQREDWRWADVAAEFAVGQKDVASEQNKLIAVINLAIARKFGGNGTGAEALLDGRDWSASAGEFALAVAVLRDEFDKAGEIMERIGRRGEFLKEWAYHHWPLFRDFRGSQQFAAAYEKVYGYSFTLEASRRVADSDAIAAQTAGEESTQGSSDTDNGNTP